VRLGGYNALPRGNSPPTCSPAPRSGKKSKGAGNCGAYMFGYSAAAEYCSPGTYRQGSGFEMGTTLDQPWISRSGKDTFPIGGPVLCGR